MNHTSVFHSTMENWKPHKSKIRHDVKVARDDDNNIRYGNDVQIYWRQRMRLQHLKTTNIKGSL